MRKSLGLLLVLVLLVTACGVSCGESLTEKIAGTWYENEEILGDSLSETSRPGYAYTFLFNEDGTGKMTGQNGDSVVETELKWQEEKKIIKDKVVQEKNKSRMFPFNDVRSKVIT